MTRPQAAGTVAKDFPYRSDIVITSKLTSKAQTTIPQAVRAALNLHEGDELEYRLEAGRVILTKRANETMDDPFRTFDEWHSNADAEAYAEL